LKSKHAREKLQRQNLLLSIIGNVNQLLIREKDRTRLLQGVCNHLIENRAYQHAWIVLLDESQNVISAVEAGLGSNFRPLSEVLERNELPDCTRRAVQRSATVVTQNPFSECKKCPLAEEYKGRAGLAVPLVHDEKLFGMLTVSITGNLSEDEQEHCILEEVAEDIGFALHGIELREQKHEADETLRRTLIELRERTKELNCLYSISSLIENRRYSLEEVLQGAVNLLPDGWRYPDITCARIVFGDREFRTGNFAETDWRQACDLFVKGKPSGKLEIYYFEPKPESDEGPFLREERNLLDAIAERLGKTIERRRTESELEESEKRFRDLVENSLTGISIIQDDRVIYQNQELERLLGPLPRSNALGDYANIHPDDIEKVQRLSQEISAGKIRKLDLDFRLFPASIKGEKSLMKWVYCRAMRIDYRGKESILVNMVDMTKTKELEQLLIIQDKMASLGRVAAGIAHEIRNPLSGINIYLNTLGKIYDKAESRVKVEQILRQLKSASGKIESVIRRVMDFSKPSEPKFSLIDINQPVKEAINLIGVTLRKSGIKVETALAENMPPCKADPNLIEEMVLNLINNAAEAMRTVRGDKRISVTTGVEEDRINIKVADSGPGIPEGIRDKIFNPFYTTKHDSTGIGLSLCSRIVNDHQGTMQVHDSKPGGAEFRIEIPIK
jgi:PAS domain S-box-containing protein